ncbi:MAG: DNA adenine methylase [Bifidobacteriaceae bacterium]|jgi:adenine-specific DNA-methyltransferase|nr:DNA adenine methylase [Bifidobacteriaceae bacterium]
MSALAKLRDVQSSDYNPTNRYFEIQNRRYLGNKNALLSFIQSVVTEKCADYTSFCDIFSGTGVVGNHFNTPNVKIISNDILKSNYVSLSTFLESVDLELRRISHLIDGLNKLPMMPCNYFAEHFSNTFFTEVNASKIGTIRDGIDCLGVPETEKNALITSLLYAADKVANTCGHYDAFVKHLDKEQVIRLLAPKVKAQCNQNNEVYNEDANLLIKKINCDVLYLDPPYNSRQYSDAYHLLENLVTWKKPEVFGKAKKMDRTHIKSKYCMNSAPQAFADLIAYADCKHILLSYNNTGDSKGGRSNARITDEQIFETLNKRGKVQVFEQEYRAFTTGKSSKDGNVERLFYCKVQK